MQTNQISIATLAPIYPSAHLAVLRERVSRAVPDLSPDQYDTFLCTLYGVEGIEDLTDQDGILSWPEYQPALSSDELHAMAVRIANLTGDGPENGKQARWVARNVLDCVPREISDLVDYLLDESLITINMSMLLGTDYLTLPDMPEARFYDEAMEGRTAADIDVPAWLAMEHFQDKDVDSLNCLTHRQKLLSRAAEFYAVHRYGFKTASLWLAKFTHLVDFCGCPSLDCPGRHFGFLDVQGSASIVLDSLPFIEKTIRESAKTIPASENITIDEIATSDIELTLCAAESLMKVDDARVDADRIATLLRFGLNHQTLMSGNNPILLIRILRTFVDLYGPQSFEKVGLSKGVLDQAFEESVFALEDTVKEMKGEPPGREWLLFDSQNFMRAGSAMVSWNYGLELQLGFLKAMHSPQEYERFTRMIKGFLAEKKNLDPQAQALFDGYLDNIPGVLASCSIATWAFCDSLLQQSPEEKVMRVLSEMGHQASMQRRLDQAGSEWEEAYWSERIKAHS